MSNIFSHIYIEERALEYPLVKMVTDRFYNSKIIILNHYKDILNRHNQDFQLQKKHMKLILAVKEDNFIYKGSDFCHNFGNRNFFYCSTMLNCIYNCDYCYLQGMYPSANITAFVNIEDFYNEAASLKNNPFLAISYDTDLLAFEGVIPYVTSWLDFASKHKDITLEVRTKSANYKAVSNIKSIDNVIFAWTLTPCPISEKYEKQAPGLIPRINSINEAIQDGWKVRLCFDPLISAVDYKDLYGNFVEFVFSNVPADKIFDISIGTFRMPSDYLKRIRKIRPDSDMIFYPYVCKNGYAGYPEEIEKELLNYVYTKVSQYIDKERIYK